MKPSRITPLEPRSGTLLAPGQFCPAFAFPHFFRITILLLLIVPALPAQEKFTVTAGSSQIEVSTDDTWPKLSTAQRKHWIQNAADAVVAYYGRYPVPHVFLQLRSFDGTGVRGGKTFSSRGGFVCIDGGCDNTEGDPRSDWMFTHAIVHVTVSSVPD